MISCLVSCLLHPLNMAAEDEYYSVLWNMLLSFASVVNGVLLIRYVLIPHLWMSKYLNFSKLPSVSHGCSRFWHSVYDYRYLLAAIYVFACGVRSWWPRHDSDRHCFVDYWMSYVFVGRSLATVAELAYCAQLCLIVISLTEDVTMATLLFLANICAQTCCWFTVLTQDQRGHSIEESIWTLSAVALCFKLLVNFNSNKYHLSSDAHSFLNSFAIAGPAYILFMCTIDIPMYVNRFHADTAANRQYLGLWEGVLDTLHCVTVSKKDSYWTAEMPWMSLYFTLAVWSSIWMASADIFRKPRKCD